jgi:drug/metabolite transporter (DMT)-like permease
VRPLPLTRLPNAGLGRVPPAWPRTNERLRGILLLISATMLFSSSDAMAKYVTATLPVIEVAWVRYVVFVLLALLPAARDGAGLLLTRRPWLQAIRGVAVVASALLFILGLQVLPLITALAVPLLGERVALGQWIALLAGLSGAVLAAQPGAGAFRFGAAFPLLSAVAWAFAMVITRQLAATEQSGTTLLWTAASGLLVLTCLLPFGARWPSGVELTLCLSIGVVASGGQWLVVLAYRLAPASLLAPFSYLQLIWSTLLSYVVFGARPAVTTLIGAAVIAGSGLYAAGRQRTRTA